jgi:N-acetylmuramoyl-L-alanine amidase
MSPFLKRALPLLILFALLLPVGIYFAGKKAPPPAVAPAPVETAAASPTLSVLADTPDWSALEVFQETITRDDFERLLTTVFASGSAWRRFIDIDENEARIQTGDSAEFLLRFAPPGQAATPPRAWKTTADLPPAPPGKPLDGLHIAIDPGHIGGEWAKIEERWFVVGDGTPVREGDMTLKVAGLLKTQLETFGATVSLVRTKAEPVTPLRPEDLLGLAAETLDASATPAAIRRTAERFFYRTAEIRARAELVNETLKPDLVLCLHFNAERDRAVKTPCQHQGGHKGQPAPQPVHGQRGQPGADAVKLMLGEPEQRHGPKAEGKGELRAFHG